MNFKDLDILAKYCLNRVDRNKFRQLMGTIYESENYIDGLWDSFRENPLMFMVARNETVLFENIMKEISEINYMG